jgi:hypothetical protein
MSRAVPGPRRSGGLELSSGRAGIAARWSPVVRCVLLSAAVFTIARWRSQCFRASAVKALQALPLVESGAAEAWGFGDRNSPWPRLPMAASPAHVELAAAMLLRTGPREADLDAVRICPAIPGSAAQLIGKVGGPASCTTMFWQAREFPRRGAPLGVDHRGYVKAGHPVQQAVRERWNPLPRGAWVGCLRDRWLFHSDLCRGAACPGPRLCPLRTGTGLQPSPRRRGPADL